MSRPDETFIVRVRQEEGDAVVEQPRLSRRRQVRDIGQIGAVIARWLPPSQPDSTAGGQSKEGATR